ncbi:MAG: CoA transferase [Myxococcales bacterium]|nr:MAG: CoA transferase [Myxococcales bacterium]
MTEPSARPLEGLRVIDLTMWFQGPVAGQHLADLGAEVIHFENPKGGDLARGISSIKALPVGDWNQYFLVINRNKKSMAVDLNKPQGREIMHKLVETSDVFLTNLSAKALEKWDVGYERLAGINPRLVYAMGSGYGPKGTITKPSFDMTVQALIGLMARQGEPGQPPVYLGMGSGDAMGGLMAAFGIMLALNARERTGRGQFLDASLYGAQLFMAAPSFLGYLATRRDRYSRQVSRKDAENPLTNTYAASDGWLFLAMPNRDAAYAALCKAHGDAALANDERFTTMRGRMKNATALISELDARFAARPKQHWIEAFAEHGVTASAVGTLKDLSEDEQAWANDYFVKAHCSQVNREVSVRGLPVSFAKTPGRVDTLGPELGQDTELILFDTLGYDWDRIAEFKSTGAIL